MAVYLTNQQNALPAKSQTIKRRLGKILKDLGRDGYSLSIMLVDDQQMRQINKEYRNKDKTTNVLSFPLMTFEAPGGQPLDEDLAGEKMLGDIVISTQTIIKEAAEYEYTDGEMFYFYLIHGLLHLLGYDHELGPKEAQEQERETERLWQIIPHSL